MEHRNGARRLISLNVNLRQSGIDFGWYVASDIGGGGLAIKGRIQGLENNSLITVQVERLIDGEVQYIELRAFVIHQNNNTIGLMWAEHHFGVDNSAKRGSFLAA